MRNFPELYEARLSAAAFEPIVPIDDALREAVAIRGRSLVAQGA